MEHSKVLAPSVTFEEVMDAIEGESYTILPNHRTTVCQLTLMGGRFTVEGSSACVSPENFDEAEGRKYSKEAAVRKIWPLLGFLLAQKMHLIDEMTPLTGAMAEMNKHSTEAAQTYVGSRAVHAIKMTRAGYNGLRGWTMPPDEVGEDPGFLVQTDTGPINLEGFTGFVTWVPQAVFEKAYRTAVVPQVKTWLERLMAEAEALEEKTTKLKIFLNQEPPVVALAPEEIRDLEEQYGWMAHYLATLKRRIDRALNIK